MPLIPYSFIPGEKARRLSNNKPEFIEEQQERDFMKDNPVLYGHYGQNEFKRIWLDGLVEEYDNGSLKYSRLPVCNVCQADC